MKAIEDILSDPRVEAAEAKYSCLKLEKAAAQRVWQTQREWAEAAQDEFESAITEASGLVGRVLRQGTIKVLVEKVLYQEAYECLEVYGQVLDSQGQPVQNDRMWLRIDKFTADHGPYNPNQSELPTAEYLRDLAARLGEVRSHYQYNTTEDDLARLSDIARFFETLKSEPATIREDHP